MMEWSLYIFYALIVFGLLILFHELGHFTLAKLTGVQVYEFSIGFGPRITGFRRGETVYNWRAIPLGGFVRMAGMDPDEDQREAQRNDGNRKTGADEQVSAGPIVDPARSFMHKSVPKRIAIIAAGPIMNFVLAILLFSLSIYIFGWATLPNKVGEVLPDKPAAKAGIKTGDVINKINGSAVGNWEDVVEIIHGSPSRPITLEINRGGETRYFSVVPERDTGSGRGLIGIKPEATPVMERKGIFESVSLGVVQTYRVLDMTKDFIQKMLAKQMPVQLSGPVRITYELGKAAKMGFNTLINIAGFLSLQIGLFNLLPIPALDGSRIMFLGIEGLRGTPIDPSKENFIHLVGLALLLLLMVVITYQDIVQMIG